MNSFGFSFEDARDRVFCILIALVKIILGIVF